MIRERYWAELLAVADQVLQVALAACRQELWNYRQMETVSDTEAYQHKSNQKFVSIYLHFVSVDYTSEQE